MLRSLLILTLMGAAFCAPPFALENNASEGVKMTASKLGSFNVDPLQTTVSGLSSGGFFAVQMQVAFSETIMGAGIFAGGPYDCSGGSISTATTTCMSAILGAPNADKLASLTETRAKSGSIDSTDNLSHHRVFMFSGTQDVTVKPAVMKSLEKYYAHFIPASQVVFEQGIQAAHTQPTDDPANKNACTTSASPYLSNCNYDGAGKALNHLYSSLSPRNEGTLSSTVSSFDQSEFAGQDMDSTGYVYVPKACSEGAACRLHISFHGCVQNYGKIGDAYVQHSGYNKWADTNNIIVLYPQVGMSATNQCWNWWGYDGDSNYDIKSGSQMSAIKKMIDRIAAGQAPPLPAPANVHVTSTSDSSVSLAWDAVPSADGYVIYRDTQQVATSTSPSYVDASLPSGTEFTYTVSAFINGKAAKSAPSQPVNAKTTGNPPPVAPPTGVSVSGETDQTVSLQWNAAKGAVSYNIYRDGNKDASAITNTVYTESNLTPETAYQFSVSSVAADGSESARSAPVSATTKSSFVCESFTASNYAHVQAGRAHDVGGYAVAVGSEQKMGLDNIFMSSTLSEVKSGYYQIGGCTVENEVLV